MEALDRPGAHRAPARDGCGVAEDPYAVCPGPNPSRAVSAGRVGVCLLIAWRTAVQERVAPKLVSWTHMWVQLGHWRWRRLPVLDSR